MNIVTSGEHQRLLTENWQLWNSKLPAGHTACLKIYKHFITPLNLSPVLPAFQLQFGQTAVLPFVHAKQCGIEGSDYLQLTDCCRDGKIMYKATCTLLNCPQTNNNNISLIIHFDVALCKSFLPSHLEQLAIACPNLQQLVLSGCTQCLKSLQGLCAIAKHCHNLQGQTYRSRSWKVNFTFGKY